MRRTGLAIVAVALGAPQGILAQTVRFNFDGVSLTYQEVREGRSSTGQGGGGGIELRVGRFRLDARAYTARLEPDSGGSEYDFKQVDVRVSYAVNELLALEVGGGRRYVDPENATQEVGLIRIGVLSENQIARLADVWVRGAYLANPRFSGGGSADLAFEFQLGVGLGTANKRFRFHAEYEFQRIDREVGTNDVPIQLSLARAGISFGF
jgi:hypothetical protein